MSYELLSYEFCSETETETEAELLSTEYWDLSMHNSLTRISYLVYMYVQYSCTLYTDMIMTYDMHIIHSSLHHSLFYISQDVMSCMLLWLIGCKLD